MNTQPIADVTFVEYIQCLKSWRWRIASFVLFASLVGCTIGLILPVMYTAKITVAPTSRHTSFGLQSVNSIASRFGGLAGLSALSLGSSRNSAETLTILGSNSLTEQFISERNLLPILYSNKWNNITHTWNTLSPKSRPTLWMAARLFARKIRVISKGPQPGIITMRITWSNPREAADWANGLVALLNKNLRDAAINRAKRALLFLEAQAQKTSLLPIRKAISGAMESELERELSARGETEYALKILDPAQAPQKPSSKRPIVWFLLGALGSTGISLIFTYIYLAWTPRNN
jgi:uncharacterized protein involved in exopolysaccharide biosynthesis